MSLSKPTQGLEELLDRPLSDAEIERATLDMAAPLEDNSRDRRSVLLIACGQEIFAIPSKEVAKVVHRTKVHRVPHRTNAVFRGISNHDGEILLCMDLEQALSLPAPPEDAPRMQVVIGGVRDRWAFLVDRVLGVTEIAEAALNAAPVTVGAARAGCVIALAQTPEGPASLLDLQRLASIFRGAVS